MVQLQTIVGNQQVRRYLAGSQAPPKAKPALHARGVPLGVASLPKGPSATRRPNPIVQRTLIGSPAEREAIGTASAFNAQKRLKEELMKAKGPEEARRILAIFVTSREREPEGFFRQVWEATLNENKPPPIGTFPADDAKEAKAPNDAFVSLELESALTSGSARRVASAVTTAGTGLGKAADSIDKVTEGVTKKITGAVTAGAGLYSEHKAKAYSPFVDEPNGDVLPYVRPEDELKTEREPSDGESLLRGTASKGDIAKRGAVTGAEFVLKKVVGLPATMLKGLAHGAVEIAQAAASGMKSIGDSAGMGILKSKATSVYERVNLLPDKDVYTNPEGQKALLLALDLLTTSLFFGGAKSTAASAVGASGLPSKEAGAGSAALSQDIAKLPTGRAIGRQVQRAKGAFGSSKAQIESIASTLTTQAESGMEFDQKLAREILLQLRLSVTATDDEIIRALGRTPEAGPTGMEPELKRDEEDFAADNKQDFGRDYKPDFGWHDKLNFDEDDNADFKWD